MKMSTLLKCVAVGAEVAIALNNPTRAIKRHIRHIPAPAPPVPPRQLVNVIAVNVMVDETSSCNLQEILRRPLHADTLNTRGFRLSSGFRMLALDVAQALGMSSDSVCRYAALNLVLLKTELGELDADDIYNVFQSGVLFQLYPKQLEATEHSQYFVDRLIEKLPGVRRQVRQGDMTYRDMLRIADTLNRL